MSHLVDIMAYTNKKPWWLGLDGVHGYDGAGEARFLGNEAVDSATMARMAFPRRDGALGTWQVEKRDAAFKLKEHEVRKIRKTMEGTNSRLLNQRVGDAWKQATGEYFLIRDDDLTPLGRCKDIYVPFQIEDVFEFMDSLREGYGLQYHTAGSLMHGKKIWALAQLPGEFVVNRQDGSKNHHVPFLLMTAGHDGSTGIWLIGTDVRAECWNTVTWAEDRAERDGMRYGIPHTASAKEKVQEAKVALDLLTEREREFAEVAQDLADHHMGHEEFLLFANAVILDIEGTMEEAREAVIKAREAKTERGLTILDNKVSTLHHSFAHGHGNLGYDRYDALQSITQGYDHRAIDERYAQAKEAAERIQKYSRAVDSAWFGTGARRKRAALRTLQKW